MRRPCAVREIRVKISSRRRARAPEWPRPWSGTLPALIISGEVGLESADERSARAANRARLTGVLGTLLVLIGYAVPFRGPTHGFWQSLLLGPVGGGFHLPLNYRIFTPLRPLGVVAVLMYASLARGDRSVRLLSAGVMIGAGVAEGLFFISLLGAGLVNTLAIWIGALGSVVVLISGVNTWRTRDLHP